MTATDTFIGLSRKYGPARLKSACNRALLHDNVHYRSVKTILEKGLDQLPSETPLAPLPIYPGGPLPAAGLGQLTGEVRHMNPSPELSPMLKQLRLSGILDSLDTRNRQAIGEKLSYMDFLDTILQDEIARRTQKKLALGLRRACFRNPKTIEEFDFAFNPGISRQLVLELASCRFVQEKLWLH